jgi:predicted AlkP superfamily phosphohydrolase/phosphomutase
MDKGRTVIIGLDGMPYGLMNKFAQDGTMPNFGALVDEGVFRQMASSIPEVSSVAWSSAITGTNPGEHGVFGFTDVAPGTYRTTFPNYNNLKVKPFWEREGNGRSVIINVPTTFPARDGQA